MQTQTLTVKKMPKDLYDLLKQNAQLHHRSMNNEVINCLEKILKSKQLDPDQFLLEIKTMQKSMALPPLTDKIIAEAKNKGRP